jgi:hypothetical protein
LIQDTLIAIISSLPDPETFAKFANRDETLLIVLVNVVRLFGGTMLPDELGDAYPVMSAMDRDYAATATLAGMFALIFQEPLVNVGRFASEDSERDGEPYRWFIPVGSPFCQTSVCVILSSPSLIRCRPLFMLKIFFEDTSQ